MREQNLKIRSRGFRTDRVIGRCACWYEKRTYPIPFKLPTPVTMHTLSFSRSERGHVERCHWIFARRWTVVSRDRRSVCECLVLAQRS